nr:LuxR C-terminal-related transcriptional regulator [Methylosinus sp. Sm6]
MTERQRDILRLSMHGRPNKQIRRRSKLSHFTVRNHVSQLSRQLNVPSPPRRMSRPCLIDGAARALLAPSVMAHYLPRPCREQRPRDRVRDMSARREDDLTFECRPLKRSPVHGVMRRLPRAVRTGTRRTSKLDRGRSVSL